MWQAFERRALLHAPFAAAFICFPAQRFIGGHGDVFEQFSRRSAASRQCRFCVVADGGQRAYSVLVHPFRLYFDFRVLVFDGDPRSDVEEVSVIGPFGCVFRKCVHWDALGRFFVGFCGHVVVF